MLLDPLYTPLIENPRRARIILLDSGERRARVFSAEGAWGARERDGEAHGGGAAYHAALEEGSRERVPLQWANSTGNQGVALMLLAKRRGDAKMAGSVSVF